MIFRKNNVMLLFLMPDGKAESVKRVFDYLEAGLGIEVFRRLFPVILTDNGSEFKKVDELEHTTDDEGFHELMRLLKMHLIPPDEVHLMPDLFVEK